MPRASTVVKLVLLTSALGVIGWIFYSVWEDTWYGSSSSGTGSHGGYYHSHGWFYGGGGYSGGSAPAPSGGITRGGFGGHAAVGGGE